MNQRFDQRRRRSNVSLLAWFSLMGLSLFPTLAIIRAAQTLDARVVCAYLAAVSALTYLLYGHDKKRAESGGWRTPESTLHLVELFGGWPAAFLAQRVFRHKISKISYQAAFWTIIVFHEAACFDYIQKWRYTRTAILLLHQ